LRRISLGKDDRWRRIAGACRIRVVACKSGNV
jgi:hypothetical protein